MKTKQMIQSFLDKITQAAKVGETDFSGQQAEHSKIYTEIRVFDKSLGPELQIGKLLSFSVADGYAHYLVTKLTKQWVYVVHLDLWDGYQEMVVFDGKIQRGIVERQLRWDAEMDKHFAK